MPRVIKYILSSFIYKLIRAFIVLIIGMVGSVLFISFVMFGALLFLSGVTGTNMCMSIGYTASLWKFILIAVIGLTIMIGGLALGTWFIEEWDIEWDIERK